MFSYSFFGMFKNTATALRLNRNPPQPRLAIDVGNDQISVVDLNSNALIGSAPLAHVRATPGESTLSLPRVGQQTTPVLVVAVPNAQPLTIGCPNTYDAPQTSWSGRTKFNHRFTWRGDVRAEPEPEFVVTDADWLTLVETLGLAAYLDDNGRSERDGNGPVWTQRNAIGESAPLAQPKRKRKWWVFVVIFIVMMFIAPSAMIWVSSNINYGRELKDQQLTASRERQFALPFTDLRLPHGVAVDGAGNVYVTDTHTNRVLKLAAGSNTQTVLPFTGLDLSDGGVIDADTAGIAVDTAGDVYVTDSGHNRVLKLAAGSTTQSVLPFRRVSIPRGVAVDTAGTVYVVDFNGRIVKLAPGSSTQTALPSTGGGNLSDVAVDTAGTVYANVFRCPGKSSCSSTLLKLPAGSNTWVALPSTGRSQTSVTVDTAGNVYVLALGQTGSVMKLTPGSQQWTELPGAHRFVDPMGLAVDAHGNVYVTDHTGSREPLALFGIWKIGDDDAHGFVLKLPVG
jgi:streptogramin lyase